MNPVRDLDIISQELRLKDVEYMRKRVVSVCSYHTPQQLFLLHTVYTCTFTCNASPIGPLSYTTAMVSCV